MSETITTPEETKHLHCKFCHVKVRRWRKVGKRVIDGWDTLKDHVLLYHPEEADKMEMTW